MKKFKLQLQNINGEIEKENEIIIGENDTLIMQFPQDMSLEMAYKYYEVLSKAIENGGVAGMMNTITFKVIKAN